ncbi:hypothetical protein HJFPF1_04469 [Paramyrothecium foliicola]|nr:hypothetical protein HJFPF1_04469 [Paramyrothecium foliicola]
MSQLIAIGSSMRFQDWYSSYGPIFNETSSGTCNDTLAAYVADYRNFETQTCNLHLDCVLSESTESLKAKMASAAIFLGILPPMLSMLGPSITQLSMLSARRPLLSLLVSVGSTGFYLDRLFRPENPAEILSVVPGERHVPRVRSAMVGILISVFEYLLAGAAVLNVVNLAVRVGDRTIMSFECNMWFLPVVWVFSLTFVFLFVAVPFQFSAVAKHIRNCTGPKRTNHPKPDEGSASADDMRWVPLQDRERESTYPPSKPVRQTSATTFVLREVTSGLQHDSLAIHEIPHFEPWVALLFNIGSFMVAFHVILGTCFFSSVLFLGPLDAMKIILRFFGSAVACRLIIMVELASMKSRELAHEES